MSEVIVTIFNHNYRLAVSTGEEDLLKNCAKLVDDQMSAVRASGKVIAVDQIAVLSALEIAYDSQKKEAETTSALAAAEEKAEGTQKALEAVQAQQAATEKAQLEAETAAAPASEPATPVPALQTEKVPSKESSAAEADALAEIRALCRLCEEALYKDATLGLRF